MFRTTRWLASGFLFALAAPLFAATPTFKDRAHLFSPEVVDEAKTVIEEIRAQYHKDVVIETFPAVPFYKDPWGKVKKMSQAEQDRFVLDWAKDRLSGPDAICILIVHGPALQNVQVVAGRALVAHHGFTVENCRAVRDRLHGWLGADPASAGFPDALRLVHVLLHDNLGDGGGQAPFDWEALLAVTMFAVAVAATVLYVRRKRQRSGRDGPIGTVVNIFRSHAKPAVPVAGLVKPVHEPLKDWW